MNRRECLEAATKAVCHTRSSYGDPKDCFGVVANLWSTVGFSCNGGPITAEDVALAMILLKITRQFATPNDDNWVDIAGYAACGAEVDVAPNQS